MVQPDSPLLGKDLAEACGALEQAGHRGDLDAARTPIGPTRDSWMWVRSVLDSFTESQT